LLSFAEAVSAGGLPRRASRSRKAIPQLSQQWCQDRLHRLYEPPPMPRRHPESQRHRLRRQAVCRPSVWSSPGQPSLLVMLYPSCIERGTARETSPHPFHTSRGTTTCEIVPIISPYRVPQPPPEVQQASASSTKKTPWLRHHGAKGSGMTTCLLLLSAHRRIFLIALLLFLGHARWVRARGWNCRSGRWPLPPRSDPRDHLRRPAVGSSSFGWRRSAA